MEIFSWTGGSAGLRGVLITNTALQRFSEGKAATPALTLMAEDGVMTSSHLYNPETLAADWRQKVV